GDSLLATRVVGRLRAAGFADAGVAALFAAPALRDFAARLAPPARGPVLAAPSPHRRTPTNRSRSPTCRPRT
ncbi:hypothetical protein GA0115246_109321, partial [Streptomyces sp. SolWspMP-sol7th]|uniref:hypothetical protein n=1 Tax=Streptomyces sp. SolWspMP-sol7th TaxID=1839776 RepID=UPI00081D9162